MNQNKNGRGYLSRDGTRKVRKDVRVHLEADQSEAEKIPEGQKRLACIKLCEKKVGCFTMFIVVAIAALEVLQMTFSHENSSLFFDLLNKTINSVK
mgnify:CR=1 FL=1